MGGKYPNVLYFSGGVCFVLFYEPCAWVVWQGLEFDSKVKDLQFVFPQDILRNKSLLVCFCDCLFCLRLVFLCLFDILWKICSCFFVRSCREQVMTENLALERNQMISSYWHWAMKLMWNWCWNLWVVNSIFSTPFCESPHSVSWTKYLTPICEMQSLSNEDLFHCVSEWKSDWKICLRKNLTAKLVQLIQCLQLWKQEDN